MRFERFALTLIAASLAVAAAPLAQASVVVVDPLGFGDFTAIAPAVAAAVDGDILLIRPGSYPGFDIVDKSLTLVSDGFSSPPSYTTFGRVAVKNLSAGKTVVFSGLTMYGKNLNATFDDGGSALFVETCVGAVRVQATKLVGADGSSSHKFGYPALLAIDSPNVEVMGSSAAGGDGWGINCLDDYSIDAGPGGQALRLSGSHVIVHDSTLVGGNGATCCGAGGTGGLGVANISGNVLLVRSSVKGGHGGNADDFFGPTGLLPGNGGAAVFIAAGQDVSYLDSTFAGGSGGQTLWGASGPLGTTGPIQSGPGTLTFVGFPGRSLSVTPVSRENQTTTISVEALPLETALLFVSASGGPLITGPEVVPFALGAPLLGPFALGTLSASGSTVIPVVNPLLPPGIEGVALHLQVVTSGASGFALTGPAHFVLLASYL